MPTVEYDLGYIRAGLQLLEDYLLSEELYWSINDSPPIGEPAYPQLTQGGILLAQARLQARSLPPHLESEVIHLILEIGAIHSRWRVAWEKKAVREYIARLNLWRDYLEDYHGKPEDHFDRYGYEVGRRVMLDLLDASAGEIPQAYRDLLSGLDQILRAYFTPGEFAWDEALKGGFPRDAYWYLYGKPRESIA